MNKAQHLFDRLWKDYTEQNPHARKIYELFKQEGEEVVNDHIAFRTFNDSRVNLDALAKPFLAAGYTYKGKYHFEEKRLYARHFELVPFRDAPRIFISQLITEDFSPFLQQTVQDTIGKIPESLLNSEELIYSGNTWGTPSYEVFEKLRAESEYAAWVYVHGFRANHFTVNVNALKKFNTIQSVNRFIKDHGFLLNDSAGEVKGSPDQLLEQSSTKSGIVDVEFQEGVFPVPSCYYEFAKRYPAADGELYSGFVAKSADKIFESTDYYKKGDDN